jgi:hypothetical protein
MKYQLGPQNCEVDEPFRSLMTGSLQNDALPPDQKGPVWT